MSLANARSRHWDIFCTVVDNYGDIGVTWRLARQLSQEYAIDVHLWVDDLRSFAHILPSLDPTQNCQTIVGVTIYHWTTPLPYPWQAGEVLIEAFACELPAAVLQTLTTLSQPPQWLNLEYLSAEAWIDDCHGLQSPGVAGVKKRFYFPGFSRKSGGLICETALLASRAQWQASTANTDYLQQLGVQPQPGEPVISLFCYDNAALPSLLTLWATEHCHKHLLLPQGKAFNAVAQWYQETYQQPLAWQHATQCGYLHIYPLAMTDQDGYDRLLWSCDFNFVRGEDSFLRAQWAAKPFIWHIYPQQEDAHLIKLDAFMRRYCHNLAPAAADTWKGLNLAFNQQDGQAVCHYWQQLSVVNGVLLQHAKQWPADAINDADLANRLVKMVENR